MRCFERALRQRRQASGEQHLNRYLNATLKAQRLLFAVSGPERASKKRDRQPCGLGTKIYLNLFNHSFF
jgi:hypothetical protein